MIGGYLKPYVWRMVVQLTVKLSGTVVELLLPGMLSMILDDYAPVGDMRGVWLLGAGMVCCALAAWIGNVCANRMATNISRGMTLALRRDLFEKVSRLSAAQRDEVSEASLVSRLTSDTYNVHNMVDRMQRLGVRAPILLLGGIIVSLTLEPVLTLVLIACLPLLGVTIYLSSKKGVPLFTRVQQGQDSMVRKIQENMAGARVIRALSRTEGEQEAFAEVNEELARRQRKADLTMAAVSPIVNFVLNTGLAVVVLVGAWRVHQGLAQTGAIIAFLSYFTIILNALMMVSRLFVMYSKGSASARRITDVMNLPEDLPVSPAADAESDAPHVVFRHVGFSYNKTTNNVEDLSFTLKSGQTLGVIGPTGSGKSTLLKLLMRLYDPDEGEILLSGKPLHSLTPNEIYGRLGVVFQNDFLMADSIRENIRFGREVTDEGMLAAIDCAQAAFIHGKDGGADFMLSVKGRNLSGGQQQRVLIARSLAADPRLLLLDDCSSALDYRTDRALRRALRERHGHATTIIVAQRVSAVMAADNILVMDRGRIIAQGTHEELVASCPMYQKLCQLQLGGDAA